VVVFPELEQFVDIHRLFGDLEADVADVTGVDYVVRVTCTCGHAFERRVTPDDADQDLLRFRLPGCPN
jgi:hypothetical protein